ncbi:MAG: hypothetical protein JHD28_03530, partial [Bacteroidia bacterium]|nr:hypothetical protein [Bacteroidia bacterium]
MHLTNFHFYQSKNYLYSKPVKGLSGCGVGYRFAFNGKENDDETETQDYGMRIYDYRLGKFLSVDPLTKSFPSLTPYQFASNSPIANIDLDGLEATFFMLQYTSDKSVKLITHKAIDLKLETLFGKINCNISDVSYVFGTDGNWHKIPKEWESKSFNEAGSIKDILGMVNSWENANKAYQGVLMGEALQKIGESAELAVGLVTLGRGLKDLAYKGVSALKGTQYEEYLAKTLKCGRKGFLKGGRDFDGKYLNKAGKVSWFEAKSGNFWRDQTSTEAGFAKFRSDMGDRLRIAKENGVEYELFSNSPI